jgi:Glucose-6-phosphate dehydrogenase, NAD binding domain
MLVRTRLQLGVMVHSDFGPAALLMRFVKHHVRARLHLLLLVRCCGHWQDVCALSFLSSFLSTDNIAGVQVSYHRGQYNQPEGYRGLLEKLVQKEGQHGGSVGRLFYLAIPPSSYADVAAMLKQECADVSTRASDRASNGNGCKPAEASWVRLVIEKPFGKDLDSSEELSQRIAHNFSEEQVYRIDHYLGKELSQVRSLSYGP